MTAQRTPENLEESWCADGTKVVFPLAPMDAFLKMADLDAWLVTQKISALYRADIVRSLQTAMKEMPELDWRKQDDMVRYLLKTREADPARPNRKYPHNKFAWFAFKHWLKYLFGKSFREWLLEYGDAVKPLRFEYTERTKDFKDLDDAVKERIVSLIPDFRHRLMARLQNETGIRAGDLLRVRRGDVRYETDVRGRMNLVIHFRGKGERKHTVWIFDDRLKLLMEHYIKARQGSDDFYFQCNPEGLSEEQRYKSSYYRYAAALQTACLAAGISVGEWASHDWRRSAANRVWKKYKDIVLLKQFMNHADINTTAKYVEANKLRVRDVFEEMHDDKVAQDAKYAEAQGPRGGSK
jgi:integrase